MGQTETDMRKLVQAGFDGQPFMRFLNAQLTSLGDGLVEITVPYRKELTQQHGLFHGGVIATLADNVAGFAAYSLMSPDEQPLSIEFKINLISKAEGIHLVARGKVLKNGKRIKVCQAEVFCQKNNEEYMCAIALVSVIATKEKLATVKI